MTVVCENEQKKHNKKDRFFGAQHFYFECEWQCCRVKKLAAVFISTPQHYWKIISFFLTQNMLT